MKRGMWKKALITAAVVLAVAWLGLVGCAAWAMHQPPEKFGRIMKHVPGPAFMVLPFETLWTRARAGSLGVGDMAPDFDLETLDKTSRVQLSSLRGKPVVLVFGSYT